MYDNITNLGDNMWAAQLADGGTIRHVVKELNMYPHKMSGFDKGGTIRFWALFACNGKPCVLIKTRGDAVTLCRANNGARPTQYISHVVSFIIGHEFHIAADMACTGIIRQKGNYYNIYDLPQGFVYIGNMDLSWAGLYELPDMSTVIIRGNYNISGNYLRNFYCAPREVFGDFDVSKNHLPHIASRKLPTIIHGRFINDFGARQHKCY